MKTMLVFFVFFFALPTSQALAQLNNATGNNYGFVMKPMQWDLGDRPEARIAMERGGYTMCEYANSDTTQSPSPTILDWITEMTAGAGAGMINTHSNLTGQIVEAYPYTPEGKMNRDIVLFQYQLAYGNLVMIADKDNVSFGIGVRYSALTSPTYVNFNQGIFHNQGCDGDQFPFIGNLAFACGPTGLCTISSSEQNVEFFWEGLQGVDGVTVTPAGVAMSNAPQLTKIGGNDNTVLFPHPLAFSHASGTRVPSSGTLTVRFQTNCNMNTVTLPATLMATATGDVQVQNAWYSASNEITVDLARDPNVVNGEGWLGISGAWASASGLLVTLDGGNDYVVRFIVGDGPAADVTGFSVVNGIAEWQVGSEWHTLHYIVEASPGPEGPWAAVGSPEPPGSAGHAVSVSGYGPYFRLIEVEEGVNARRIVHGRVKEVGQWKPLTHTMPSVAYMQQEFARLKGGRSAAMSGESGASAGVGQRMTVFTAGDSATTDIYLADPWRWQGYAVSVVSVANFPRGANNEFQDYLKQAIVDSAAAGVAYFWLVGDSGHPAFAEVWNPDWEPIRQQQISWGYDAQGQPQNDEIPSWKFDDPEPRGVNWAFHNPHYYSDAPYWNTDGDSLRSPDVVGARLPFSDDVSIISYGFKMAYASSGVFGPQTVTFLVDDQDYDEVGDGALARQVADTVQSQVQALATVAQITRLDRSDEPGDNANTDRTASHLNQTRPNVICLFGALSHRYFPGNYMDLTIANPWSFDLTNSYASLVLAYSCGGGGFWRNEDPDIGIPVVHRALAHWSSGTVNWVGPGDGANQMANQVLGIYTVQELATTDRPAAESFMVAMQRARTDYGVQIEYAPSFDMFTFLGNPLSRVDQMPIATAVAGDVVPKQVVLDQNYPNPFNPVTRIRYATTRPGPVSLRVYDVAGRLVRTLVDGPQPPGFHGVTWDGSNDRGEQVVSGVYFYRLVASGGQRSLTRKMVVLK